MDSAHLRLWEKGKEMLPFLTLHSPFLLLSPAAFSVTQDLSQSSCYCEMEYSLLILWQCMGMADEG